MAFDNSGANAFWAARLGTTQKGCELQLFLARTQKAVWRWKALDLGRLNVLFQQECGMVWYGKDKFNVHWPNSLGLIEGFCTVCEQPWLAKRWKITALLSFWRKTEKLNSTDLYGVPLEGSTFFSLTQLLWPYIEKLSISWAEICKFQLDKTLD